MSRLAVMMMFLMGNLGISPCLQGQIIPIINQNHCLLKNAGGSILGDIVLPVDKKDQTGTVCRQPEYDCFFGPGMRYTWKFNPQPGLTGEIHLSTFVLEKFILIGGSVKTVGPDPVYVENVVPCDIYIERPNLSQCRLYVNSGTNWTSGSMALSNPDVLTTLCQSICVFQGSERSDCLGVGSITIHRAETKMNRTMKDNRLRISPTIKYNRIRLDPGQTLQMETQMVNSHFQGGSYALEEWIDAAVKVIQPKFNRSLAGLYNVFYAYWSPERRQANEALFLKCCRELRQTGLRDYGISYIGCGLWHNRAAFGEEEPWPGLLPHGWEWLITQMREQGVELKYGSFWGHASRCATVFRQHPEWMVHDREGKLMQQGETSWAGCSEPYYDFDWSNPQVREWFKTKVLQPFAISGGKYFSFDFFGSMEEGEDQRILTDPRVLVPTEFDRLQVKIARDALGEGCIIGTYSSRTTSLVGLVDRVRTGLDCGRLDPSPYSGEKIELGSKRYIEDTDARWELLKQVHRNLAATSGFNGKFWINDPDPMMVGIYDRSNTLEEARVRIMICACSGGFPTVGEALSFMSAARLDLLKKALPVFGQSARPIDLMEKDIPSVHHLHLALWDGGWDIITLFNWGNSSAQYLVDLERLGLQHSYHVFEFWTQRYEGISSRRLSVSIPGRSCRVFRLSRVLNRPQVIGTDRHVTVGGRELLDVQWNGAKRMLSGISVRPLPEQGMIVVYVPTGWSALDDQGRQLSLTGNLLSNRVRFSPQGNPWSIAFVSPSINSK